MCEEGVYKKVDKSKAWERKVEGPPTERPLSGCEISRELGGRDQGQGGTEVHDMGGIYVYTWLIHFIVQQKITQYCRATVLQLEKKDDDVISMFGKLGVKTLREREEKWPLTRNCWMPECCCQETHYTSLLPIVK